MGGAAQAAQAPGQDGTIDGTVSAQEGSVRLPGVLVSLRGPSDQQVAEQISDEQGHFTLTGVPAGRYRVRASLDGFQTTDAAVTVARGQVASVTIDLPIAALSETVDVVAASPVIAASGTMASSDTVSSTQAELLAPGDGVQSTLKLLSSVIQQPGGASIDGGRPDQVGFQIQAGSFVDPATNLSRLSLPGDGLDSVSVLPNPYEVEFGRFSSGVVAVQTRSAASRWKTDFDNAEPALRLKRFTLFDVKGIAAVKPSLVTGGPLFGGRALFEQSVQFRYQTTDIPSLPETELRTDKTLSTLTRIDAKLSARHSVVFTGGTFPGSSDQSTLGTFTPPDATANVTSRVDYAMLTERFLVSQDAFVESTVQLHDYDIDVAGQGTAPMTLLPETTLGNFFNQQDRHSAAYQWVETASDSRHALGGQHLFKVGFDVLNSHYSGTSVSEPVLVARSDGTLARKLDFTGPTAQDVRTTDIAAFAQDRFQPAARWYVDFGGRVDRDSIIGRSAFTPRAGAAVVLNTAGTAVLRGGYGLFYERTPSIAAAFGDFQAAVDTRYAADGVTPLGPPVLYAHVTAPDLQAAHSATWDVAYDHQLNPELSLHVGVLDRQGSHQLILDPLLNGGAGELLLSSTGRSSYRQAEVSMHMTRGTRVDLQASYVRSSAREDLNGLINFYSAVLTPIVGANAYAPAAADAPNRFLLHGTTMPTPGWILLGTLEWRNGLPYSIVDDAIEFVGARNDHRFPTYVRLDAGFDRRIAIGRLHPWLGVRVSNALNSFLPADVQADIGSPAFGSFYNSVYREYRIHIRFAK
jgi:hypothetical protein